MADREHVNLPPRRSHVRAESIDDSILNTRALEAFSRKVTATTSHLLGPLGEGASQHYQNALGDLHREFRHPSRQRQLFSLAQASPRELVRSKLSVAEIQHRALTYLPDEILVNIPDNESPYSLFQGFQASLAEDEQSAKRWNRRSGARGRKLIGDSTETRPDDTPALSTLRNEKRSLDHRLEMFEVRKNMCSTEITEIDNKIANLNNMRKIVLERLASLEQEEAQLEHEILDADARLEDLEEEIRDEALLSGQKTPSKSSEADQAPDSPAAEASFMSESIYEKLPSSKPKRPKQSRRKTTFILHEHLQSGSKIREFQAHHEMISALDFDIPFGTMVSAAMDDTVRVWDLNAGHCIGLLEGHLSSVRCLKVEENIVATGSMDATVRLWDLNQAEYTPRPPENATNRLSSQDSDDEGDSFEDAPSTSQTPEKQAASSATSNMKGCPIFTLSAHVAEVTALHFHNSTLISGSADKTLRQWDLEKGRCVQTLDILWAAAQASSSINSSLSGKDNEPSIWHKAGRKTDASADFVGALQCFDAALACGTADGMVRLWDLRSGQVHRSLVGHTGPVTCLQFDDVHLITGSADRSIRIWDLRTGSIVDAWGYANSVTSMKFDARRVVAAAGESVVKVYDKTDGRHWDCGATSSPGASESERNQSITNSAIVEQVSIRDSYLIEGRDDGIVGVWSC